MDGRKCIARRVCYWLVPRVILASAILGHWAFADPAITTGSEALARQYYAHISKDFGFDATPGTTTLDSLLAFTGYPISGAKLEALDPAILMNPIRAASQVQGLGLPLRGLSGATFREGDILAARFFAPKIVNVDTAAPIPGWRK